MANRIWYAKPKGAYAKESAEAIQNGRNTWAILSSYGWALEAICGLLGNIGWEGGYNPWRWQGDRVQPTYATPWTNIGYGFTQFTPGGKYINSGAAKAIAGYAPNFSNKNGQTSDAEAQMVFLNAYADYYPTSRFPYSYAEFKQGYHIVIEYDDDDEPYEVKKYWTPYEMAAIWLLNYERPSDQSTAVQRIRGNEANYWYTLFSGEPAPPPYDPGYDPGTPPDPPAPPPLPGKRYHINPQILIFTPRWKKLFYGKN